MCWNDSNKRKKFNSFEKKQSELFRKAGMCEKNIQEMYEFDYSLYCGDRNYYTYIQENNDELSNKDMENIIYQIIDDKDVYDPRIEHTDRFYWLDEIEDELLYKAIKRLDDNQKELLTLIFVDGFSMTYIAENIYHVSVSTITRKSKLLYEKIKKSYKEMELNRYEISI